jgi:hypothetical protein
VLRPVKDPDGIQPKLLLWVSKKEIFGWVTNGKKLRKTAMTCNGRK